MLYSNIETERSKAEGRQYKLSSVFGMPTLVTHICTPYPKTLSVRNFQCGEKHKIN
jgi:hypothetical protein